mmetsp:Transcript_8479/g.31323  ORF Transcript_8479/g.31323 Transcript_8479/m.31323 type:complete len:97 (-) Transcript_8479:782-1072(-)
MAGLISEFQNGSMMGGAYAGGGGTVQWQLALVYFVYYGIIMSHWGSFFATDALLLQRTTFGFLVRIHYSRRCGNCIEHLVMFVHRYGLISYLLIQC